MGNETVSQMKALNNISEKMCQSINVIIDQISEDVSKQWMSTHDEVKNQIFDDAKHQGDLITYQKDVNIIDNSKKKKLNYFILRPNVNYLN